ncbi:hypothetical protein LshimejAT787_0403730 [Lyophyllum shimeji]|uniref:Uncharacterized protein n=1 Tax=Lyophyllum shimeji TaxID=47721 RepID=A0A9P3PL61_LYOSH|nr:hypothetical protein LshimejAT787_0403730 [Lyophyllum shimeji]
MGPVGVLFRFLVACSLLPGRCWAGPIDIRINTPGNLKKRESVVSHDAAHDLGLDTQKAFAKESRSLVVRPRSTTHATSPSSMWAVTAVIAVILLICLLVVVAVLIRRSKERQKAASDEELGFGKHPMARPDLASPPKAYDGASRSPPAKVETIEISGNTRKPPPPPLLTVSSPEEPGPKPKRVPAPLPSPRLIGLPPSPQSALPPSPRLGLPPSPRPGLHPSPRLIGLPPSPRLPASPRLQRSHSGTHFYEPPQDVDRPSSPRARAVWSE